MSESILAQATAQIYLFDRSTKRWITPDGLDTSNDPQSTNQLAQILLLHHVGRGTFRIVGMQKDGRGIIIETKLFARIKYQKANDMFHQWRDEQKQVFGVNFADHYEASIFYQNVIKVLNSMEDNPNIDPGGDLYQDPAVITNGRLGGNQQQNGMVNGNNVGYTNGMSHDVDQDSITSSNSHGYLNGNSQMTVQIQAMNNASVLRKPSYIIPQQQSNPNLATQQQNQRRASQGSSGSSTHSSTNYSVPSNGTTGNGTATTRNIPPPPPPPNVSLKSSCPVTNNPPPPPPLPVNLKTECKGNSLADQLKKAQLKKVNSVEGNGTPTTVTPKSSISANKGDLLSELAAKITKRKNQEEIKSNGSGDSVNVSDKKSSETSSTNGTLVQNNSNISLRSWKQTTSNGDINTNGVDSPKTHRKIPSVSSLSSQEDPLKNINHSTGQVTVADLERHKQDVLAEVQKKLQTFKLEIVQEVVAAIRNELRSS
ncbi:WH1/EVH1 domain and Pleckstrin homology-like domain and VASP tetramerisation domain-containing protein [Strongyloides ratti]|uniref:WH1/EVH1 domain and Pleckstrin homology-like domain and VASP tetramerisation domain-containing protein n=1 Tax=Strongyloides ratti TaxID=34506 RepID=A0A090MZJ0_STRRB|nr:WH1/EVH1 domain and Pleckstrin homology-like domain and VASP tetramerisation domain-containing protein [Strongyloides ratti]CEF69019.1 WH1/EVH1 domain and Pleckstrin homology-like domain and VASP tetramerisation domain-containing protein [Strongyloides ratti]